MEANDTNAQAQPTPAPVAAGPTAAELQAQLDEIKKQSEGRLRDLQNERAKRQELEAQINIPASPAANSGVTDDELGRVLKPYIEPLHKKTAELEARYADEKALNYLSTKTGKSVEAVLSDTTLQDKLMGTARKWGLTGDSFTVSKRAYELMELEDLRQKEADRARSASAASATTLPTGTGPVSTGRTVKKYSAAEFDVMSPREFGELSNSGDFRKLPDGTFEHISR
jgi:hypothetical protein